MATPKGFWYHFEGVWHCNQALIFLGALCGLFPEQQLVKQFCFKMPSNAQFCQLSAFVGHRNRPQKVHKMNITRFLSQRTFKNDNINTKWSLLPSLYL